MDENMPIPLQAALAIWAGVGPLLTMWYFTYLNPVMKQRRHQSRILKQPLVWEVRVQSTGYDRRTQVVVRQVRRLDGKVEVEGQPIQIAIVDPDQPDSDVADQLRAGIHKAQDFMSEMVAAGVA